MCAKKSPATPTKQVGLTGITKSPVKKVAPKQQTTKTKIDDSIIVKSSAIAKDVKTNAEAKKLETKSTATATSIKKVSKATANEARSSNPSTPIKSSKQTQSVKDTKKTISRDSSADVKARKLPINGKAGKACDRDKVAENKSNHVKDNKVNVKSDEVKSKSNSANEQCNKFEKSSSALSQKSNGESDNVIKEKVQSCKKMKPNLSPSSTPKKVNNKASSEGVKKSADKSKSSKAATKANNEKDIKIKITNELKNLGIEMARSNEFLAVVTQEGMTSGVKTSICEMVKTKARYCSNLNSQIPPAKKISEVKSLSNKANKEFQEKVSAEVKANTESIESKKTNSEPIKIIEKPKEDEKKAQQEPAVVKNKISALVNAKNKIKSSNELKISEEMVKSVEAEPSKPAKRKYAKKKRPEDATDGSKNSATVFEADARNNDKIDHNKSNCVNISDGRNSEVKGTSKADARNESKAESAVVCEKDGIEGSTVSQSGGKLVANKTKGVGKQLAMKPDGLKVDLPTVAAKIKRKYVKKKAKPIELVAGEKSKEKPQKDDVQQQPKPIKVERDKSSEANELNKLSNESQKNGVMEKKPKNVAASAKDDQKKCPEKISKHVTPKKDALKIESKVDKTRNNAGEKKSNEKLVKGTPKKQKIEIKKERDPLESHSSESENPSTSDSDSERSEDTTFKKPNKPSIQRNLRYKKQKQIACKRTRVASLNAAAKVHCLYENEARSAFETNISKAVKKTYDGSSDEDDEDAVEEESKEIDLASKR